MFERTNYCTNAKWEDIVGYSRAVRIGNIIEVTGTVAVDENNDLVPEADERHKVYKNPDDPGEKSGEVKRAKICNGFISSNGSKNAFIKIFKFLPRLCGG